MVTMVTSAAVIVTNVTLVKQVQQTVVGEGLEPEVDVKFVVEVEGIFIPGVHGSVT